MIPAAKSVSATTGAGKDGRPAIVTLGPGLGWTHHKIGDADVSVKGCLFDAGQTLTGSSAARHAVGLLAAAESDEALITSLRALKGQFALVIATATRQIATVDRIRSIPLVFAEKDGRVFIDDRGRRLRDRLALTARDLDPDQVLAVAMSGYSIGAATLYRGMRQLRCGEALICDARGSRTLRWHIYDAWRTAASAQPERELSELHRFMMERLAGSAAGRTIAVPLSAGLDSRMIASGLKAVGYPHVRLFSYGRAGNHEAETARAIAERLGYPWTFVPFTTAIQRAMFANPAHEQALWQDADTCGGVPFEQDWTAISSLKQSGWLPADSLIVNGQTGDYISGNHAPEKLINLGKDQSVQIRQDALTASYLTKHYRLWRALGTPANDQRMTPLLLAEASAAGATFGHDEALHGIHEFLECQDRQAKYVVSGERTYEALGFEWRLPLWDDEYIALWQRTEGSLKLNQNLYRRVLEADNWGGVWRGIPVNAKTIRPRWIIPLRFAAKAAFAVAGRDAWHDFERRAFGWWLDSLRLSAVIPYSKALGSNLGARHAMAWIAERYLQQHGVALASLATRQ